MLEKISMLDQRRDSIPIASTAKSAMNAPGSVSLNLTFVFIRKAHKDGDEECSVTIISAGGVLVDVADDLSNMVVPEKPYSFVDGDLDGQYAENFVLKPGIS